MMMWMLWSIGFAALIFLGAMAAERVAGVFGVARRHVWMVAIVAAAVVPPILATQARTQSEPELVLVEVFPQGLPPFLGSPGRVARPAIVHVPESRARVASRRTTDANRAAIALWVIASLLVGTVFARTILRLRRDSETWKEITVGEYRALLAPNAGPAVVGFTQPRIVLPEWALTIEAGLRDLMLCHEAEHIRASDPRTVFIAGALLVVFPWNAMMWLIVRQLRRAIEIDCDARVIRAAGDATAYGRVLLTVGERFTAPIPLNASLSAQSPLLEQRIRVMTTPRTRRPLRVAMPFIALSLLVTTAAVRAPRPASLGPISIGSQPAVPVRNSAPNPARDATHPTETAPRDSAALRRARAAIADAQSPEERAQAMKALPELRPPYEIDAPQSNVVPAQVKSDPAPFDRAYALATARSNFPEVMRGDVKANSLIMIFDASGQFVRGFPAVGGVMIAVGGDTLTAQQRIALQRNASDNAGSGQRGAGRGGRGGGATGAAPPSSGRPAGYMLGFGMTATRDSLGNSRPGPANTSVGLTTIPVSGDVSGIVGVPSTAITNVDQFTLSTNDGFAARFDLLAVHLTAARDTTGSATRARPEVATFDFEVHNAAPPVARDTGQVQEKTKATVKELFLLPMPVPAAVKPYLLHACFEVAANGAPRLLAWTRTRDSSYNRKIEESLGKYSFNVATRGGAAVQDTVCVQSSVR